MATRPRTGFAYLDDGLEDGHVLAIAHRGGALHPDVVGLENTRAAFGHAVALGYRYLETDVHATSDGVLLAFHDAGLARLTGLRGRVADHTYSEMALARIGGREAVPRVVDLLEEYPTARFNIDIKGPEAVSPLADLISATRSQSRVCVGSFSERDIRLFRRLAPGVLTVRGVVAATLNALVPRGHLLDRLAHDPGMVYQVPHRRLGTRVVDAGFVSRAHASGRHVHVWTVDDPEEMRNLIAIGVDGLMTDRTDVLREVLVDCGRWREAA